LDLHALISSIIFGGKWSFNPPSTPSQLNLALLPLSFIHHNLSTTAPTLALSPQTSNINSAASPFPPLRDVGSINIALVPSQARIQSQPPLPFPKGCGRVSLARRRIRGGRKMQETHEVGAQVVSSEIQAMTFVVVRFRYLSSYPLTLPPG